MLKRIREEHEPKAEQTTLFDPRMARSEGRTR